MIKTRVWKKNEQLDHSKQRTSSEFRDAKCSSKVSNLVHYHSPHACTAVKSTQLLKKARIAILLQAILMFVPSLDNVEHYKLKPKSKVDRGRFIWRERSRFLYGALIRNYNAFVSGKIFQLLLLLWVIYKKSISCNCMQVFISFNQIQHQLDVWLLQGSWQTSKNLHASPLDFPSILSKDIL